MGRDAPHVEGHIEIAEPLGAGDAGLRPSVIAESAARRA
jgi:hypothetical protein